MADFGTTGDDNFPGTTGDDDFDALAGNDTLAGLEGADTLSGGEGNDSLDGGEGDDRLRGGQGVDSLDGGDGQDTLDVTGEPSSFQVNLTTGVSNRYVDTAWAAEDTATNFEHIVAGGGWDHLTGSSGANSIEGGAGHDGLWGEGGDDTLRGDAGGDYLAGGDGNDVIDGGADIDRVSYGTAGQGVTVNLNLAGPQNTGQGQDTLIGIEQVSGSGYGDTLVGDGGANWLWGSISSDGTSGNDSIDGGGGDDLVQVAAGAHTVEGGEGADILSFNGNLVDEEFPGVNVTLVGSGVQNTGRGGMSISGFEGLSGTSYADTLTGNAGANTLAGYSGNDSLAGGDGNDTLLGDGIVAPDSPVGNAGPITTYTDAPNPGADTLSGGAGADSLYGGQGNDGLNGDAGDDTLSGGQGADSLTGGMGNDLLQGDEGHDRLNTNGPGVDTLEGGDGDDVLVVANFTFNGNPVFSNFLGVVLDGGSGLDYMEVGGEVHFQGSLEDMEGISFQPAYNGPAGGGTLVQAPAVLTMSADEFDFNFGGDDSGAVTVRGVGHLNLQLVADEALNLSGLVLEANSSLTIFIDGTDGNDTVMGSSLDDVLHADAGDDSVNLGDGDDFVQADQGSGQTLTLTTGAGSDTIELTSEFAGVVVVADFLAGPGGDHVDFEDLIDHHAPTLLDGGANPFATGHLRLFQNGPDVELQFDADGGGDDWTPLIVFQNRVVGVFTGDNFDGFDPNPGMTLTGTPGNDILSGGSQGDTIAGAAGHDTLTGAGGADSLAGDAGNDSLVGGEGADTLAGAAGNDILEGGDGNDLLQSTGNSGVDYLAGEDGDDTLTITNLTFNGTNIFGNFAGTTLDGGAGVDYVGVGGSVYFQGSLEDMEGISFLPPFNGTVGPNTIVIAPPVLGMDASAFDFNYGGGDSGAVTIRGTGHLNIFIDGADNEAFSLAGLVLETGASLTVFIQGSDANDTVTGSSVGEDLRTGGGNDVIAMGGGDDYVRAEQGVGETLTLTLGAGLDTIELGVPSEHTTRAFEGTVVVTDFTAGVGGDEVDLEDFLTARSGLADDGPNPFATGHLRLVQVGAHTELQFDANGGGDSWTTLIVFENRTPNLFTADNFDGFDPHAGVVQTGTAGPDTLAGGLGADTLNGAGGNDSISGLGGNDSVAGGDGFDQVFGDGGHDTVMGGDGNDALMGGAGNDLLDGGAGAGDIAIYAGPNAVNVDLSVSGPQTVSADHGTDTLIGIENVGGSNGNDTLTGNAGDNILLGNVGADSLSGGAGNDTLNGGVGDDVLDGGTNGVLRPTRTTFSGDAADYSQAGNAVVINLAASGPQATGYGNDTLIGIESVIGSIYNDTLAGNDGDNIFAAGAGDDSMQGGAGNDAFGGHAGDDTMDGGDGHEDVASYILSSGAVNVSLATTAAQDVGAGLGLDTLLNIEALIGSNYNDTLTGSAGNDFLDAADGADIVTGDAGEDALRGNAGDDTLSGGAGNDYLVGGAGNDSLDGGAGVDRVAYGDAVVGVTVNLNLTGAQNTGHGSDVLTGIEHVSGSLQNDTLTGDGGANWLWGMAGNDQLRGMGGDDLLTPGQGSVSLLDGGAGNDTVEFEGLFAGGVSVTLATQGSAQNTGQGSLTLISIENLTGTVLHNDTLTGDGAANVLAGWGGNDMLSGGAGHDVLLGDGATYTATFAGGGGPIQTVDDDGGAGNDTLTGGAGNDVIKGGGGSDLAVYSGARADYNIVVAGDGTVTVTDLRSGSPDGTDTLTGVEMLQFSDSAMPVGTGSQSSGTPGADTLNGSAGPDTLSGLAGDDILSGLGGADLVMGNEGGDIVSGGDNNDTVLGGAGNDMVFGNAGDDSMDGGLGLDRAAFHNGASPVNVDLAITGPQNTGQGTDTLANFEHLSGTNGNDTLAGNDGDNWLWGFNSGNENISGRGGADAIMVSAGNHTLDGGAGSDTLVVGYVTPGGVNVSIGLAGSQTTGQGEWQVSGFEHAAGGLYADTLAGNGEGNTLAGGRGSDSLVGGDGNDLLLGDGQIGPSNNTVVTTLDAPFADAPAGGDMTFADTLEGGDGADTLRGGAGNDVLNGGAGPDTAAFSGPRSSYTVTVNADNSVTVTDNRTGSPDGTDTLTGVEFLQFADQTVSAYAGPGATIPGSSAGDNLAGTSAADTISGGDGNDTLMGQSGNDSLSGGAGWDQLYGGAGNDTLDGGADVNDVAIYAGATGAVNVTLATTGLQNVGGDQGFDTLVNVEQLVGSGFNDTLTGSAENNFLWGLNGADSISGGAGNDTVRGGGGNDTLDGGASGAVRGHRTSVGGDFADYGDATVNVTVSLAVNGAQAVGDGLGFDTLVNVENLVGGAGNDQLTGNAVDNYLGGAAGDDTLTGGAGNDVLEGGAGNDLLDGGAGTQDAASYLRAGAGVIANLTDGVAQADGDSGSDTLVGVEQLVGSHYDDELTGDAQANYIDGASGADEIDGAGGADELLGGAGDDTIFGGEGNDSLSGEAGNDSLIGGAGSDTVVFAGVRSDYTVTLNGDGTITVVDNRTGSPDGTDTLSGVEFLRFADLTMDPYAGSNQTGGSGADTLVGGQLADTLSGAGGDDIISGAQGNDRLDGGVGHDVLNGQAGDDTVQGGDGDDQVRGQGGNNSLSGGAGHDFLDAQEGNDTIDGGAGLDRVSYYHATSGVVVNLNNQGTPQALWGTDTLINIEHVSGSMHNDTITGDSTDNWLLPNGGDNLVSGGGGNDLISVSEPGGANTLDGGAGSDTLAFFGVNITAGVTASLADAGAQNWGAGTVTLTGFENLSGSDFADTLAGDDAGNVVAGGAGNDSISGAGGADLLLGDGQVTTASFNGTGAGPVTTVQDAGGAGADTFTGGAGNDTIVGGGGNDVAVYSGARSQYTISMSGDGTVTVSGPDGVDTLRGVELLQFTDGTVAPGVGENLTGGTGNDTMTGGAGADTLNGAAGQDELTGALGNDLLEGGDHGDVLRGGEGADTLLGGAGDDLLTPGAGADSVDGGTGVDRVSYGDANTGVNVSLAAAGAQNTGWGLDTLAGVEHVTGSAFNDTLTGDGGANWLWGLDSGTESISGGGGDDLIFVGRGNHILAGGADIDTLGFYATSLTAPVTVSLAQQGASQNTGQGFMTLTGFENLSGTMIGGDVLTGDAGANVLAGWGGADTLSGGIGDDLLLGDGVIFPVDGVITTIHEDTSVGAGADSLSGGAGADSLIGGGGNDVLNGGAGADSVSGGAGVDTAAYAGASGGVTVNLTTGVSSGADGADTLSGVEDLIGSGFNDNLTGSTTQNRLAGGAGNDMLDGAGGDDTLLGEAGQDNLKGGTGADALQGGADADLLEGGEGNDTLDGGAGFDRVSFTTGASTGVNLSLATASAQDTGQGHDTLIGIEHVTGTAFSDTLTGDGAGNWLWGASGGVDSLSGGGGDDLIQVASGDHTVSGGAGVDALSFGSAGGGVTFALGTNGVAATGQGSMTVDGFENVSGSIHGDTLTGTGAGEMIAGDLGADELSGGAGNDVLSGDGRIFVDATGAIGLVEGATGGADTIDAGTGSDIVVAGAGADHVTVAPAAGQTTRVTLGDGVDTLVLEAATRGLVVVTDFRAGSGGDVLDLEAVLIDRLPGWDSATENPFEEGFLRLVQDGTTTVIEIDVDGGEDNWVPFMRLENTSSLMLDASNLGWQPLPEIIGGSGGDVFEWVPGSPATGVDGGEGVDEVAIEAPALAPGQSVGITTDGENVLLDLDGDGDTDLSVTNVEELVLNGERIVLTGDFSGTGLAPNTIYYEGTTEPGTENNSFDASGMTSLESINAQGFDGDDTLIGANADDLLLGGEGADSLSGRGDADVLEGGLGDDDLDGGDGEDVAVFTGNSTEYTVSVAGGVITVTGADGVDTLTNIEKLRFDNGDFDENTAPVGQNSAVSVLTGTTKVFTVSDFGFTDADGDSLHAVQISTLPTSGTLELNGVAVTANQLILAADIAAGLLVFTPAGTTTATFTFQVQDAGVVGWGSNTDATPNSMSISVTQPPTGGGGGGSNVITSGTTGTPGADVAAFGLGNDSFSAGDGADTVTSSGGEDFVHGNLGADSLSGGEGNDTVHGGQENDVVNGDAGNDAVFGDRGDDSVFGGAGDDRVDGGDGSNFLRGGDGNDVVTGGSGFDDAHGNIGDDTVNGAGGDDWVVGGQGQDLLYGGEGWDVSLGNLGSDTIYGGQGGDWLRGGQADDAIYGEDGDDWMSGDRGADTLVGGAGADTFHTWTDAGVDRVLDFSVLDGDRVNLLAGTTYSVAQVGADTVITMGDSQMVLVGVQLSTLPEGWIFGA